MGEDAALADSRFGADPYPARAQSRTYAVAVAAVFFVLCSAVMLRHEMWEDEMHVWLLARYSHSVSDFLHNWRYEPHPVPWGLMVYGVVRIVENPLAMQLFHALLATGVVYIFVRYAPFSRLARTLFCFGYFPFYEFGVISRTYSLGLLLLVAACACYRSRSAQRYWLTAVLLAAATQANLYAVMMALLLAVVLFSEPWLFRNVPSQPRPGPRFLAAAGIVAGSACLSLLQMVRPSDANWEMESHLGLDWGRLSATLALVWNVFVPLPAAVARSWNRNFLDPSRLTALLSLLLVLLTASFFFRKWPVLIAYLAGIFGMLAFSYVKHLGYMRNYGHIFIFFVLCLWVAADFPERTPSWMTWPASLSPKVHQYVLIVLLSVQVAGAALAAEFDWWFVFSQAKPTAQFLIDHGMADAPIVPNDDYGTEPVGAFLHRQLFYLPELQQKFIVQLRQHQMAPIPPIEGAVQLCTMKQQDVLLISRYHPMISSQLRTVAEFGGSISGEDYYIYQVSCPASAGAVWRQNPALP